MTFLENTRERTETESQGFWLEAPRPVEHVWSGKFTRFHLGYLLLFLKPSKMPRLSHVTSNTYVVSVTCFCEPVNVLWWHGTRSAWPCWAPFPRNPFPVYFWLGWATWDIHMRDLEAEGKQQPFSSWHTLRLICWPTSLLWAAVGPAGTPPMMKFLKAKWFHASVSDKRGTESQETAWALSLWMWFKQKDRAGVTVVNLNEFWSRLAWKGRFRNTRKMKALIWPRDPGSLPSCSLSPGTLLPSSSHDKGMQEDRGRVLDQLCSWLCFWAIPYPLHRLHRDVGGWEEED